MYTNEASDDLLSGNPDFVLDCIDDTDTKSDLILACKRLSCKFIVSLGAGAKADPTRIHISDISDALADPLGVKIRLLLKQKNIKMSKHSSALGALRDGIPVVYSSEKSSRKLLKVTPGKKAKGANHFGSVDNFLCTYHASPRHIACNFWHDNGILCFDIFSRTAICSILYGFSF